MINNLTMFYKIVAIIETVLLVIASIVGAKIYSQNTILHSNFSIENTGTIKTIKKSSLDEALLYQTNYDEVEKIAEGTHERFVINNDKFMGKAGGKAQG